AGWGVPEAVFNGAVVCLCGLGVCIWAKQILLRNISAEVEFLPPNPDEIRALDRDALLRYTDAYEDLGFVQAEDFTTLNDSPHAVPVFVRLFTHPVHHCFASAYQALPRQALGHGLGKMHGEIASHLAEGWTMSTFNRAPLTLSYLWRRPRALWASL